MWYRFIDNFDQNRITYTSLSKSTSLRSFVSTLVDSFEVVDSLQAFVVDSRDAKTFVLSLKFFDFTFLKIVR